MKIVISVHGRWHAFELAAELHRIGHSINLITTYPLYAVRQIIGREFSGATKPILEARRRLYDRWKVGSKPDLKIARSFGKFSAERLPKELDVFVGWSSASLEAIPVVRSRGGKVVIERGSTHIQHQAQILLAAYDKLGIKFFNISAEMIKREIMEYQKSDKIVVPTEYCASTFLDRGVPRERLFVNPYGVDLSIFNPPKIRQNYNPVRIICVGNVSVRKGAPWLIEAIRALGNGVVCHMIGPVEEQLRKVLLSNCPKNIILRGSLPKQMLPDEYRKADIFCLPSLEEGFPLSLLQAMASGLPCVVTDAACGEIVENGKNGFVVPAMDGEALAGTISELMNDNSLRVQLGSRARESVEVGYSWTDYAGRSSGLYEGLIK